MPDEQFGENYFQPKPGKQAAGYESYNEQGMGGKFDLITSAIWRLCLKNDVEKKRLSGIKVLELGGAMGFLSKRLAKLPGVASSLNLDISSFATRNSEHRPTVQADMTQLPIAENSVDLIASNDTLEHNENTTQILQQIRRVLKPDGQAFLVITLKSSYKAPLPDGKLKDDSTHVQMQEEKWWREQFLENGFKIKDNLITKAFNLFQSFQPKVKSPAWPFREGIFIISKPAK